MFSSTPKGTKLTFGKFREALQSGQLNRTNMYSVRIGDGYIRFQDRPAVGSGRSSGEVRSFYVPIVDIAETDLNEITDLLKQRGVQYEYAEPPSEWQGLISLFVVSLLFMMVLLFLLRRVGGAGTAMSFGRSRGRMYAQEDMDITFDDVAGIDEAVEELKEVVEFLKNPAKYQALGGRIPRGVLLVGPPGTGKTLLAKAVAGEAGVPFFSLSGSDFVEMFVGVGAARVRDMFQQATAKSPCIVFIDELDALGKVRGSGLPGGHDEREQTLNALLVEMDGFSTEQSVIVMGATNRPETLDPALLRPGRFDRHVLVDRPDIRGREAILKVHVKNIKMDDTVDLARLARLTPGFVGADLANLVNEAALLAARANKKCVTMAEFEEAIERVVAGLEKQTRIIHEEEKLRVAYHECGHALVACKLPNTDPVHKISIIPRGMGALGYTLQRPEEDRHLIMQSELTHRIAVLLGGIVAEELVFQETSTGAQNDLEKATDLARRMVTEFGMSPRLGRVHYSESRTSPFLGVSSFPAEYRHSEETLREIDLEIRRIIDEAMQKAYDVLTTHRAALDDMARELMRVEVMDAEQLHEILERHKTGPQISPGTLAPTPEPVRPFESPARPDVREQPRVPPVGEEPAGA
ncbi:MAG: ATP-dependent metallopeptidase FtsH/Yme1/Tma family protein [Planctomycetota bacterium]|nr:MAG: ATP-dependent metallopeptidase FtsH/Yme1/Tma family protein [Planctomycetota bacterium]